MTEKLKVSREVADAIEAARKSMSDEALLTYHAEGIVTSESFWVAKEIAALNQLSPYQLATALLVGYEAEMTPHEYVTKHYNIAKRNRKESLEKGDRESAMLNRGVMVGIKRTLRAFQITVEGVNNDNDN